MLRLATVFSGIGAIEHALDRMNIEHKIVFACDNGDVEIEKNYKVNLDIDSIRKEIQELKNKVAEFVASFVDEKSIDYASQLEFMLEAVDSEFNKLTGKLEYSNLSKEIVDGAIDDAIDILEKVKESTTTSKKKKV